MITEKDFQVESGTDLWEVLPIYEAMLSTGATCEQISGIIIDLTEMFHVTCYESELTRVIDILGRAGKLYYENCAGKLFSLTGHILPGEDAGYLELKPLMEFPVTEVALAIAGGATGVLGANEIAQLWSQCQAWYYTVAQTRFVVPYSSIEATIAAKQIMAIRPQNPVSMEVFTTEFNWRLSVSIQVTALAILFAATEVAALIAELSEQKPPFQIPQRDNESQIYPGGISFSWTAVSKNPSFKFEDLTTVDGGSTIMRTGEKTGTLTLFSDTILEATFSSEVTLTTIADPTEGGTIKPAGTTKHKMDEEVEVYANPLTQYQFMRWSGDATGQEPIVTVIMDRDKTVIGQFIHEWTLTTEAEPPEGGTTFPVEYEGLDKDLVVITATANEGYEFIRWTGDFESSNNPATVELDNDKLITANFEKLLKLTVTSNPSEGGSTIPSGETFLPTGTEVTVLAQPNENYEFINWTGDRAGTDLVLTFTINKDTSIVANFRAIYKLTTSVSPEGYGIVTPAGTTEFRQDEEVVITATEIGLHGFVGWSGDASGLTNPITLKMDANKNVVANFVEPVTLTVSTEPADIGEVAPRGVSEHKLGTSVDITATETNTVIFLGWAGDAAGTTNPLTILMDNNKVVVARFASKKRLDISVSPADAGSFSPTGDNLYPPDEKVVILAIPNEDYLFDHWSGDIESINNPETVTMTDNLTVVGNLVRKRTLITSATEGGTVSPEGVIELKDMAEIQLTANPNEGQTFIGWDGDATGSTNPLTVIMDRDKSIIATFATRYRLTTYADVSRGTISPPGVTWHEPMAEVTVAAAPLHEGYLFVEFGGDLSGAENPQSLIMDSDKNVWAVFSDSCRLTTSVDGEGSISSPPESFVAKGSQVVITATAAEEWVFHAWGGDLLLSGNPLKFIIEEDTEVIAIFKRVKTLTTEVSPSGLPGTCSVDPSGSTDWKEGTEVVITASEGADYKFSYWSGVDSIYANPTAVLMDEDKTVTAHFLKATTLTITINPAGRGYTIPPGVGAPEEELKVPDGESVTIMAYASSAGWSFDHWGGDYEPNNSRSNPIELQMTKDKTITANFVESSPKPPVNPVTIEIETEGDGTEEKDGGTVLPSQTISLETGETAVIHAYPDEDYDFEGWQDEGDWDPDEEPIDDPQDPQAEVKPKKDHKIKSRFRFNWPKLERRMLEIEQDILANPTDCELLQNSYEEIKEIQERKLNGMPFDIQDKITSNLYLIEEYYSLSCQPLLRFSLAEVTPPEAGSLRRELTYSPDPASFRYPVLFPPKGGIGEASDIWYQNSQFYIYADPQADFEFVEWVPKGGTFNNSLITDYPGWWTLTADSSIGALFKRRNL